MQNPFIYLRTLRNADHTVFVVDGGQKTYFDARLRKALPFSSGQQVKRCIMESLAATLGHEEISPVTFYSEIVDNELKQKEVHSACNPRYVDQLIGGWMRAGTTVKTLKRRSPLSISAMHPIHPLLAGVNEEAGTFDMRGRPNVNVVIRKGDKEISLEELDAFLKEKNQLNPNLLNKRIDKAGRATGLFVTDIAIDLRTLFTVSIENIEPEISRETIEELKEVGWTEGKNSFGSCLICPEKKRGEIVKALAHALLNWRITSNQSRTFSLNETLCVAISQNANQVAYAIRAEINAEDERFAKILIDESGDATVYKTPACGAYIVGESGAMDALTAAETKLIAMINAYKYE
jgi:hypothetical protein